MAQMTKDPGGHTYSDMGKHNMSGKNKSGGGKQKVNDPSKGGGGDYHMSMSELHTSEMPNPAHGGHLRVNAAHGPGDMPGYESNA